MNYTIKDRINNTIQQINSQYKKFRDEIDSITSTKIYTVEEQNRRIRDTKLKYKEAAETTRENLKKCVEGWITPDIQKMYLESDREKNAAFMSTDFNMLMVGNYSDKDRFLFVRKYFGDMEAMKRFLGVPAIKDDCKLTYYILSRANRIDMEVEEVLHNFNHYLDLNVINYTPNGSGSGSTTLPLTVFEQTLTNSVDNLCSTYELIERAKTEKYDVLCYEMKMNEI